MGAVCCKKLKDRFKKVETVAFADVPANNNVGDAVDEEDYENPTLIPDIKADGTPGQVYDNAAYTPTTEPEAQSEPETTEAEPRAGETNFLFCKSNSCIHLYIEKALVLFQSTHGSKWVQLIVSETDGTGSYTWICFRANDRTYLSDSQNL